MVEKSFTVIDETGIHARPATIFVSNANKFQAEIKLQYGEKQVNMKSIMGVMSLGVPKGATIKIIVEGDEEVAVLEALESVLKAEKLVG